MKNLPKRKINVGRDKVKNRVVIRYESTIDIDPQEVPIKIRQLISQVTHMEQHKKRLEMDINSAKMELELLQKLLNDMNQN